MKRPKLMLIIGIAIGVVCFYHYWLSENISLSANENTSDADVDTVTVSLKEGRRPSVAFLLGEDKESDNPYYEQALRYYTTNAKGRTDFIVTTCRSLEEVRTYLAEHAVLNAQPWGDIHLVSHGNQWNGLSVKVTEQSKRATAQRILEYAKKNDSAFLDSSVLDDLTRIFIHSCGVGNDHQLVDAIRLYLRCKESTPTVYAPLLFEFFASDEDGKHPQRYMAENWIVNYRMDERPPDITLMNELREKYSNASTDWQGALTRTKPRWIGDSYHYTFEVPVKWTLPSDADIDTGEQQLTWLYQQDEIVKELARLTIPIEKFKWTFTKGYVTKDGEQRKGISVKGYCTMLCVVKALTQDGITNVHQPLAMNLHDSRFYYCSSDVLPQTINEN